MEIPYKEIIIDFKNDKICIAFVNFALKCFLFRYVARSRNFIIARLQLEKSYFSHSVHFKDLRIHWLLKREKMTKRLMQ